MASPAEFPNHWDELQKLPISKFKSVPYNDFMVDRVFGWKLKPSVRFLCRARWLNRTKLDERKFTTLEATQLYANRLNNLGEPIEFTVVTPDTLSTQLLPLQS